MGKAYDNWKGQSQKKKTGGPSHTKASLGEAGGVDMSLRSEIHRCSKGLEAPRR